MPEMTPEEYNTLKHYGIARRSGRYPWGSGGKYGSKGEDTAYNRGLSFTEAVDHLKAEGMSMPDIAKGLGFKSTTELRQAVTIAKNTIARADQDKAIKLREKGWSLDAIGKSFDPPKNESSVRYLLDPLVRDRAKVLETTTNMLREEMEKGGFLTIGKGTQYYIGNGVSKEKLAAAVAVLKDEGYVEHKIQIDQVGTAAGQKTTLKVLCPPGTTGREVYQNLSMVRGPTRITDDGGRTDFGMLPPLKLDSSRIKVAYKEDGGAEADGVIYVRPGVKDIEIGGSNYAQVRVNVDGTHYMKGMAMYKYDMPPGVDIIYNTNKPRGTPKLGPKDNTVLKPQSEDKDNPFGAIINRQIGPLDGSGRPKYLTSTMNLIQEEGSWDNWSRTFSRQVLSKQSPKVAKQQLDRRYEAKKKEFDEIMALTNPTVKNKLLQSFADSADSSAVHMEAAVPKGSSYHAILPFNSLKDTEVYAPNFTNSTRVALIRYPHGGTFEIPELTVNNNHPPAIKAIGRAKDAVGINSKVAERLSGADFDGDFVMVVPNNSNAIKSTPALKQLEGFDPQRYKDTSLPPLSTKYKGKLMGDVTNLITDMTIQNASMQEISQAVRHSMVVIDAEKHSLNYKKSYEDFGIAALKAKYQLTPDGSTGARTLISRATSQQHITQRKPRPASKGGPIDKATGKLVYEETPVYRTTTRTMKRTGEVRTTTVEVKKKSQQLAETDDAHSLSSGTLVEKVYADHSNRLKALANESRRVMVNNSDGVPQSATAKRVYHKEVASLNAKLTEALKNSPREQQAQLLANVIVAQKKAANPHMDDAQFKKVKSQALNEARIRAGAKKTPVEITAREWDAIQAGAISKTKLKEILNNTDIDKVKELATPRPKILMSGANLARAKRMKAAGATQADIAAALGVSLTTLKEGLDG